MNLNLCNAHSDEGQSARGETISRVAAGFALALLLAGCQSPQPEPAVDDGQHAAPAPAPVVETAAPATSVDSTAASPPPDACEHSEAGASAFLNQFVTSAETRKSHIDPRAVQAGVNPDDFRIALVDSRWVYNDPALGDADDPRIELQTRFAGNSFDVDYTKARFSNDGETVEPYGNTGSYRFEFIDGHWRLVGATPMK